MRNLEESRKKTEPPTRRFESGYLWLTRGIACLLFFAAGAKAWQLATNPSLSDGWLHARWFNILVVEFELAFAIWLLLGLLPKWTRLATIGLFSTFATVSLYKALSGESSCGCFGEARVNPWFTFILDVTIIVVSFTCRFPQEAPIKKTRTSAQWTLQTFKMAVVLSVVTATQILLFFSPFVGFEPFLTERQITFTIDESVENTGRDDVVFIIVANKIEEPIVIVGVKKSHCVSGGDIKGLPMLIQPGETSRIAFVATDIENLKSRAKQDQRILFHMDANGTKKVRAELPLYKYLTRR